MRTRHLMTVAAMLVAAAASAQESSQNNSPYPSDQSNQVDCTDPFLAASSQCNGILGGAAPGVSSGRGGASSTALPGAQMGSATTYIDDHGRLVVGQRSTSIPLPAEPLTEFQKFTSVTTGMVLPIFGTNLFQSVPSTFSPLDDTPVPSDYVIGPDDLVRLRIWGQVNFNADLRVDRTGQIFVPQVGAVHVGGLRFDDLDKTLRTAVSKIFRNFDLSVELGQTRAIQIYVTGQARRPGLYTLSSLSTLVNALFDSGGPSVQGSMRRIELRRGGAVAATFDLYRLLIDGDKSKDVKLQPGDVIFIPAVGPRVALMGSVGRAAIYELAPGDTVGNVIEEAGGLTALASEARASLERSAGHSGREVMEVKLDTAGMSTPLDDGDILHVISIVSKFEKTVTLRGNTANPGRFAWHQGMRISDLIPDKDSLLTRDYWWRRTSLGMPAPEFQAMPALSALRQPNHPIDLRLQQSMMARRQANNAEQTANTPPRGQNQVQNQPRAVDDTTAFYWDNSQSPTVNDFYNVYSSPYNAAAPGSSPAQSQNQSTAGMSSATGTGPGTNAQQQTGPRGGESALAEPANETEERTNPRRTVVQLSAPDIDWSYAVIERMDTATLKTTLLPFDLGKLVLQHDSSQDLELQPGDVVTIFSQGDIHVPIGEQTAFVRLEGEFVHSGTYSVQPGETLRSLVERAGGLTSDAYLYGSVFTRESTRVIQQRRMDETIQRMNLQMQRGTLALASSATSGPQDLAGISAAQASARDLVAQLQQVRASGRIVFAFKADSKTVDAIPDIPLENGDTFTIPPVPSTVNAVGAIFNQNSFLYRPDARLESYLRLTGGPNSDADKKHMFLVRANGAVVSRESVKGTWGNEFANMKLNPGDTIVVPDKSIKPSALRGFMNLSSFFSQLGFTAAAFATVF